MRQDEHTLAYLLDSMERAAEKETVSINDVCMRSATVPSHR